ncbi:MAG: phosphoenolpyruvate carboxykinase (GTP) [Deltaproteobacteria bacterium]|nr:phosphoenolpyruvate carboxykinase (GTP) [Deltaproteobacteria bacterium]
MPENALVFLHDNLEAGQYAKLAAVDNPEVHEFVAGQIALCRPDSVFVCDDSAQDVEYLRRAARDRGEEIALALEGHTAHFDSCYDQGRDKKNTRLMVPPGTRLGGDINTIEQGPAREELSRLMAGLMQGREMIVRFFCLGPTSSPFSIPCIQITDSAYVAHSEDLLYRKGYEEFRRQGSSARIFRFIHCTGAVDERKTCIDIKDRRVYIDCLGRTVYSVNTQYGGNTIGLKKLAMRLAIFRAEQEGWLTEHMLLMGVHGPGGRKTWVAGAYPSMCGKTSTAMIPSETMVGDDIAYLRALDGVVRAVNVEAGMFGIIQGINAVDDPIIWDVLHTPGHQLIFSNVLISDGKPHWIDMGTPLPPHGHNHSGAWTPESLGPDGKKVPPSHPNARFTLALSDLKNTDVEALENPGGILVRALVYGGRDSDTWVPVQQAFGWEHGIIAKAASLESETTAATLGKEGVREFNPMSNIDFLSVPIGRYVGMNLEFGEHLTTPPGIFGVNYFIRDRQGKFLNQRTDKVVWLKWIELRVHGDVKARRTPTGFIPLHEDLEKLFADALGKPYSLQDYEAQFMLRIPENLAKIDRIVKTYRESVPDTPARLYEVLEEERQRLLSAREQLGDYVSPERFPVE